MSDFRNLTQSTYNRLLGNVTNHTRPAHIDVLDLLRAYEDALTLLSGKVDPGNKADRARDFLFLASGEPRVELLDEPE